MSTRTLFSLDRLTHAQQAEAMKQLHPHANIHPDSKTPSSVVERRSGDEPLAQAQAKAGYSGKYLVRVVSFRRRLLDEDNLCSKYHIDALRYASILPSDAPDQCRIETTQIKVETKEQERTEITITYPQ